jgi:hypothetical protein
MKIRKVINRPVRSKGDGVNIVGGVTGVVSANVNESGGNTVISRQKVHVVQASDRRKKAEQNP